MTKKKEGEKVLKVSVTEEIKTTEVPPGTPLADFEHGDEKLPKEEKEKRQKIMIEYTRLMGLYCKPHKKKSRWVEKKDLERVVRDGQDLVALCGLPRGRYSGIAALTHSQIEKKDPLRFFVLAKGMVIINPMIFNHTRIPIFKDEGCMSYPDKKIERMVPRYNRITVMYQTLERLEDGGEPRMTYQIVESFNGGMGHIFQHAISHCNGMNIYDKGFKPEGCVGFGDGQIPESKCNKLYKF